MTTMLVHGEGEMLAKPFQLPGWLRRAIYRIYEYNPDTFERYVTEALLVLPKNSAKTEGTGAIMLNEFAGPSVPTEDGPKMRPSPIIPVSAASWDQVGRLYGNAIRGMVEGDGTDQPGPLSEYIECFEGEALFRDGRKGRISRVAAVAGTNDGELPSATACDEIHEWTGRKERVHLVLSNAQSKRPGVIINITTPDDADPDSLLGKKIAYAEKVASGEVVDPSFYYLRYAAPDGCPLDTDDQIRVAVAAATPAEWANHERIAKRLLVDRIPVHEFRRYWLGQFVRGGGHWLPEGSWEARAGRKAKPPKGAKVVLSFDGSYRRDSTALVGCTLDGHVFVVAAWERPENAPDTWRVPRGEVKAKVAESMKLWDVVELACDPPGWHDELEQWEEAYGQVVVAFDTNQPSRMVPACSRFYSAVAGGDSDEVTVPISHDDSPTLARHLSNAVTKNKTGGVVITKESMDSPRKIDVAVAAVIAYDRACWHAVHGSTPVDAGYIPSRR